MRIILETALEIPRALVSDDTIAGDSVSKGVEGWSLHGLAGSWPAALMFLLLACWEPIPQRYPGSGSHGRVLWQLAELSPGLHPRQSCRTIAADGNFPASWESPHRGLNKDSLETRQDCFYSVRARTCGTESRRLVVDCCGQGSKRSPSPSLNPVAPTMG